MPLIISNLGLKPDHHQDAAVNAALNRLGLRKDEMQSWRVLQRSVDSRQRRRPKLVYTISVKLRSRRQEKLLAARMAGHQITLEQPAQPWQGRPGNENLPGPVVIVGAGSAGLAAAWRLAKAGYAPLLLERGADVESRIRATIALDRKGVLDPESNYCFGEGGAGCFSDGKLHTRKNDARAREFLELLVDCGAPEQLLLEGRPHVGSDRLPGTISELRERIIAAGGSIRTSCRLDSLEIENGRITTLLLAEGKRLKIGACLLAPGASARKLFESLVASEVKLEPRPIQVGLRLECSQREIDKLLYGKWAGDKQIGPAEFFLKSPAGDDYPAAHTFCMCPGGTVVPVVTEPGMLSTNGASRRSRSTGFANAAIVVPLPAAATVAENIEIQRQLEKKTFELGGSDYSFPCSLLSDFLKSRHSGQLPPAPRGVRRKAASLEGLLPASAEKALRAALENFARRMPPLGNAKACLYGTETRVGCPVRIVRETDGRASGLGNLYPAGEGSGYSAGIMSSAIDGLKAAENLIAAFARPDN
jgi:uncharacterized protein